MSAEPTQNSLVFPTPLGRSAAPARLESTPYEPRKSQDTYTYVTRLQPDVIPAGRPDGRDLHIYALFFPTQRDATGALVPGRNQDFMRDDTILSAAVDAAFPDGFGGKYRVDVNWRICWRMAGSTAFVREVKPVEGPMLPPKTAEPTLNEVFKRDENNQPIEDKPAASTATHWIDAKTNQKTYWPRVKSWAAWAGVTEKEQEAWVHQQLDVESTRQYTGTMDSAISTVIKASMRRLTLNRLNRPMTLQDFIDAVGYTDLDAARTAGVTDGDMMTLYRKYLASDKPKENAPEMQPPETPQKPPETSQRLPPATPIPETQENAPDRPSSPSNGHVASGMSEAGFSMNFFWCDGDGAETQFTMREATWQAGLDNVEQFKAGLRKLGYMPKAEYAKLHSTPAPASVAAPAVAPAPIPAPAAPAQADGGSVRIVEVKKVQDEGKTQYHLFDAPGSDRPAFRLRIENDFNKLKPFINLDAMDIGTRYAVNVIADWKPSQKVGQNGQPFRNVATIRAA